MFKQPKYKTFNFKPRFSTNNHTDSTLDDKHDIPNFISKWKRHNSNKIKVKGVMPVKTLILFLVLLLICMYILEKKYM